MKSTDFFKLPDGRQAKLFSLRNANGFGADISDFGGAIVKLLVPDKDGEVRNVALGFAKPEDYIPNPPYFGILIGRVANRISGSKFSLHGKTYHVSSNRGDVSLHGGECFGRRLWESEAVNDATLKLTLVSPDGDAGYPGKLTVEVWYTITDNDDLAIEYRAVCDQTTAVALTNHNYFNLNGEDAHNFDGHAIQLKADYYTDVKELLPTGINLPTADSPYDLRHWRSFSGIFRLLPDGMDTNFILDNIEGNFKRDVAKVYSQKTGILLTVSTTTPGIQLYTGYFLDGTANHYPQFSGFCLEAQNWPDAVNHPNFPSPKLEPGQVYRQLTVYHFEADADAAAVMK